MNAERHWAGSTALITGASSGIGAATARELAGHGIRVILVARRGDRLRGIVEDIRNTGGQAHFISADLSQKADLDRIVGQLSEKFAPIDILINNAGIGWYGYFADMPWKTAEEMLQVNMTAVVYLTHVLIPQMRARTKGHIINIGSIAGGFPNQGVSIYSASKSFLDGFSTALHREMKGSGVQVSVVRAGPVMSEFFQQAARRPQGMMIPMARFAIPAERLARKIWSLLKQPRRVIYVPGVLALTPWIELVFGWLIDRMGPLLLRNQKLRA